MHGLFFLAALVPAEGGSADDFPQNVRDSAVFATVKVLNVTQQTAGSGVVVGKKGAAVYILTAAHLVGPDDVLEIHSFSPESYPKADSVHRPAEVVATAGGVRDLALLRVTTPDPFPNALSLCPPQGVPDEESFPALAVGCGAGEAPIASVEKVLGKKRVRREEKDDTAYCWEVEGKQKLGNSGGPLVDRKGLLLGILSGANRGSSYFSHRDEVQRFLRQNGYGWMGGKQDD